MPTEVDKLSTARRAFLTGDYFTRRGREHLAAEYAEQGRSPLGTVSLNTTDCLAWQRMTCLSCKDACPDNAISLVSGLEPRIDQQRCSGCGKCAAVCPGAAIHIGLLGRQ